MQMGLAPFAVYLRAWPEGCFFFFLFSFSVLSMYIYTRVCYYPSPAFCINDTQLLPLMFILKYAEFAMNIILKWSKIILKKNYIPYLGHSEGNTCF